MDRQLSRNSTVFRRDPALHATFPGARKYPQITLQSGVLSGFPTALEPSLPRRLPPGTAPCTPLADRRAGQLPLPRDDIPPQPLVVVTLGVCRLRLARMWFPLALRLHLGVHYEKARQNSFLVGSGSRSCGKANSG